MIKENNDTDKNKKTLNNNKRQKYKQVQQYRLPDFFAAKRKGLSGAGGIATK